MPKISVIMQVYNAAKYLPKCLGSVWTQTFQNFEVICINNGSPDNSAALLNSRKENENV
jgi:glycosyltransferase involved in cell wall biosynthesis